MRYPTFCLNMIVKDEAPVIARCLKSVRPWIDYWVIVDTGSQDGTQELIKESLEGIPGELHPSPWIDFATCRNVALKQAQGKGDYLLLIDADQELTGSFRKSNCIRDAYFATVCLSKDPLRTHKGCLLINNHLEWSWEGKLHERLLCKQPYSSGVLDHVLILSDEKDGHRSKNPKTPFKDLQILEEAVRLHPEDENTLFYLAQGYLNTGQLEQSLLAYQKRAALGGWDEQVFWSKYQIGYLQERMGKPPEFFIKSYLDAYKERPTRAEPFYRLGEYFLKTGHYQLGSAFSKKGLKIPLPHDRILVEDWIYRWGLLSIFADCALKRGRLIEAAKIYEKIASIPDAPETIRAQALKLSLELSKRPTFP